MTKAIRKSRAKPIGELVGGTLDPLMRKRGLARAELIAWWPDIVGPRYAGLTAPQRISWPRSGEGRAATLVLHVDPSVALPLSYELEGVRDRLNAFLGFRAVGAIKLVQHPFPTPAEKMSRQPDKEAERRLEARLAGVEGPLRESLRQLGRAVLSRS
ncbi:DUF721 domain-containing protein [Afifella pfennigii]|uniref:DUF721 domain-containing protein n=1 Tax=Afifella pfennigii TaxID=209897 RepID=UPI0009FDBE00|nr:DciA family protein [Afifella pfennigii]